LRKSFILKFLDHKYSSGVLAYKAREVDGGIVVKGVKVKEEAPKVVLCLVKE
jgi:hypothetical protein